MIGIDFDRSTWRKYLLGLKAYRIRRCHEFENTRALLYGFAGMQPGVKNLPSIHDFWPLETDQVTSEDPETFEQKAKDHIRKVREAYKGKNPNIKNV